MCSYKLNNSYTVYVDYTYINECMKVSKHMKMLETKSIPKKKEKIMIPFPINASFKHRLWGNGTLIKKEAHGVMTIAFEDKTVRFIYPEALQKGHLVQAG